MSDSFLRALKAEILSLETELAADVRFARVTELRKVLSLYELPSVSVAPRNENTPLASRSGTGRRASPEREKALAAARMYVTNRVGPTPTSEILSHLDGMGFEIAGERPLNNLSAMLSNSDLFRSHGRSGWTLRDKEKIQRISAPERFYNIVSNVLGSLHPNELQYANDSFDSGGGIPDEIDRLLTQEFKANSGGATATDIQIDMLHSIIEQEIRSIYDAKT